MMYSIVNTTTTNRSKETIIVPYFSEILGTVSRITNKELAIIKTNKIISKSLEEKEL